MRILYLCPIGYGKVHSVDLSLLDERAYIAPGELICNLIREAIPDASIVMIETLMYQDIPDPRQTTTKERIQIFDIVLCDLTSSDPNVMYYAGLAEACDKPMLYFHNIEARIDAHVSSKVSLKYSRSAVVSGSVFMNELIVLIHIARDDPSSLKGYVSTIRKKPQVFISYSHQDRSYLDRLRVHLRPLEKKGLLDIWVDTQIKTGDKWQKEIETALADASIAVLLISADFMASDFIVDNELPPLLSKAEVKGTIILPVILSPCRFLREPELSRFQAANLPSEPLSSISEDRRDKIYDQISNEIEQSLKNS